MKPAEYYQGNEQTYIKHFFLERYLETVALHIGYSFREYVYVDCFSGPWRSADQALADTSIRIALDTINYVVKALAVQQRPVTARAIFVERDRDAYRNLEIALTQFSGRVVTKALPGTFEENIPKILDAVGQAFAFFFIDPKGWKGFAMESVSPILRHRPGEVMVNFMYDFINRFINYPDPANEASLDLCFGTKEWRSIRNSRDRELASVDCYKEQLRAAGAFPYVTSTRVLKPLSDRAYFHLVYATRSAKGILKFREIERRTLKEGEAVRSTAKREFRESRTGQAEFPFEPVEGISHLIETEREKALRAAEIELFIILAEQPVHFEKLQPLILQMPLVWSSDLNRMLAKGRQEGRIEIIGMKSGNRTPKPGHLIRLTAVE